MSANRTSKSSWLVLTATILWLSTITGWAKPHSPGVVAGRVTGSDAGRALPGAKVALAGTGPFVTTDHSGAFRMIGVPVGMQTLEVTYLGYKTKTVDVEVVASETLRQDVSLEPSGSFREDITVRDEPFLEGQSKALNQQKHSINIKNIVAADQIGRFPDPNAAEATQRIPGVTIQRDQGEGRYVLVRGSAPRLSASAINGVKIPSPDGDVRYVALDVIPADLLEAIEVTKAITPTWMETPSVETST